MKTKIYSFSGTGNSLYVSQKIANNLEETQIVSIAREFHKSQIPDEQRIGFVFPVYFYGIPRIVEEFVKKMDVSKATYIFAVITCGGNPGSTLRAFRKLLKKKGANLHSGFAVREKIGMHGKVIPIVGLVKRIAGKKAPTIDEQLENIVETIKECKINKITTSSFLANIIGDLLHAMTRNTLIKADTSFWVDQNCDLCKVCARICPRENIKVDNNNLQWNHNCEQCFACLQWCPKSAIQIGKDSQGKKRYHNSEITLHQMILR